MLFNKLSVGLELDSNEVRVVELMTGMPKPRITKWGRIPMPDGMPKPRITKWGRIPMPDGIVKDGIILNSDRASDVVKELWDKVGIKTREVTLGVLNQDVIVRFASFPKVDPDKLRGLIQFQAQDFLPLPIETLIMDYMIVDEFKKNENEMVEVLLVAAKKTMIKGFVTMCEKAQLRVKDIDVSTLSLIRLGSENDNKSAIAIANFYDDVAGILLLRKGVPRLSRIIPVSFKNKDEIKCRPDHITNPQSGPSCYDAEDVHRWSETLSDEINSSIDFYQSQKAAAIIDKVYVCGTGLKYDGLFDLMSDRFDIPLQYADTSDKINLKLRSYEKTKEFIESDFAVCISLALRGLEDK